MLRQTRACAQQQGTCRPVSHAILHLSEVCASCVHLVCMTVHDGKFSHQGKVPDQSMQRVCIGHPANKAGVG